MTVDISVFSLHNLSHSHFARILSMRTSNTIFERIKKYVDMGPFTNAIIPHSNFRGKFRLIN